MPNLVQRRVLQNPQLKPKIDNVGALKTLIDLVGPDRYVTSGYKHPHKAPMRILHGGKVNNPVEEMLQSYPIRYIEVSTTIENLPYSDKSFDAVAINLTELPVNPSDDQTTVYLTLPHRIFRCCYSQSNMNHENIMVICYHTVRRDQCLLQLADDTNKEIETLRFVFDTIDKKNTKTTTWIAQVPVFIEGHAAWAVMLLNSSSHAYFGVVHNGKTQHWNNYNVSVKC